MCIRDRDDNEYKGQKCYKLLQGKDYPCEFCTNKYLTLNQFYTWDRYNDFVNKYYNVRDLSLIHILYHV